MLKNNRGFTLLEMMVVIAIFSIIMAAVFLVLATGRNTWLSGTAYIQVQQEVRKSKEWIVKELSQGRHSTVAITAGGSTVDFQIPLNVNEGGGITWQQIRYTLGGLNNRQLLRNEGANIKVLANDITAVNFAQNLQLINVSITANKQDIRGRVFNSVLTFDIKFRN